jgi:hypothetical protein
MTDEKIDDSTDVTGQEAFIMVLPLLDTLPHLVQTYVVMNWAKYVLVNWAEHLAQGDAHTMIPALKLLVAKFAERVMEIPEVMKEELKPCGGCELCREQGVTADPESEAN